MIMTLFHSSSSSSSSSSRMMVVMMMEMMMMQLLNQFHYSRQYSLASPLLARGNVQVCISPDKV